MRIINLTVSAIVFSLAAVVYALAAVFLAPVIIIAGRLGLPDRRPIWQELCVAFGQVLAYEAIVLPLAFGSWLALALAGTVWAIAASVLGTVLLLALVGIPAPASGSKIAAMAFVLTTLSNACCLLTSISLLARQLAS